AAQDLLQSGAVHFDELRRVSHPTATGKGDRLDRPSPPGRRAVASGLQWSNPAAIPQGPTAARSGRRAPRPPVGDHTRPRRVAGREQDRQLMRGQTLCLAVGGRGPPREAALGKTLVAEPKSLAVVHEQLQGGRLAVAEDEDGAGERVVPEGLL